MPKAIFQPDPAPPVIGVNGFKHAGKDTVANYLVSEYGFKKYSFATMLKQAVAVLFDIPIEWVDDFKPKPDENPEVPRVQVILDVEGKNEYVLSWRQFLQRFGGDMGRGVFGEMFWVNLCLDQIEFDKPAVISDVRYDNEARTIWAVQGKIITVERPGFESDGHNSEQPLSAGLPDFTLLNDRGVIELTKSVDWIMNEWGYGHA